MKHHHYVVSGFMHEEPDGRLVDFSTIEVFAENEQEALDEASNLVQKKHYRVSSVITHDDKICLKDK